MSTRADHFYCRLPSKSTYNVDILKLLSMSDYKSQVDFKQKKNQRRSDPPGGFRCGVFKVAGGLGVGFKYMKFL